MKTYSILNRKTKVVLAETTDYAELQRIVSAYQRTLGMVTFNKVLLIKEK